MNKAHSIDCSSGIIRIKNVNWGRTNSETCCYGQTVDSNGDVVCTNNIDCHGDKTKIFKTKCDYKNNCPISVDLDDPCGGTYKYLDISWECLSDSYFLGIISGFLFYCLRTSQS